MADAFERRIRALWPLRDRRRSEVRSLISGLRKLREEDTLVARIERARKAQQQHEQRHDVQLELDREAS
jgi:hypothetical protein